MNVMFRPTKSVLQQRLFFKDQAHVLANRTNPCHVMFIRNHSYMTSIKKCIHQNAQKTSENKQTLKECEIVIFWLPYPLKNHMFKIIELKYIFRIHNLI